ncbi:MAG TPA: hypothetical protein PK878_01265 [bacterium]|nr:hypothetical protein [Candidatus Omnitrophota bacterium]HOJ58891.1 hypothetical protein [bacterium]HOL93538.1 hypothetical protein [bacterium]HPP00504.1 hypothetical protein [bacterium]HXK93373.1 hypothetical protein [bacterium]
MNHLDWKAFQKLFGAAANCHTLDEELDSHKRDLLSQVLQKRKALDKQQKIFCQASEENIFEEYQRLRQAHRDFLSSFKRARDEYLASQNRARVESERSLLDHAN